MTASPPPVTTGPDLACSIHTPMECLHGASVIQTVCADDISKAVDVLEPFTNAFIDAREACNDTVLDATLRSAFMPPHGAAAKLLRCAVLADPTLHRIAPHLSWSNLRSLVCPHHEYGHEHGAGSNTELTLDPILFSFFRRIGYGMLVASLLWILIRTRNPLKKIHRWRTWTATWWFILALLTLTGGSQSRNGGPMSSVQLDGYYYRDDTTECAFEVLSHVPAAVQSNRVLTVSAPNLADARTAYQNILHVRVHADGPHERLEDREDTALIDLCGYCGLTLLDTYENDAVRAEVTMRLITPGIPATRPTPEVPTTERVLFSIILPPVAHASWVRALMEHLPDVVSPSVLWFNSEQVQIDVQRTAEHDAPLAASAGIAVLFVLTFGIWRRGRGVLGSVLLSITSLGSLMTSTVVTQRLLSSFVPDSPYNIMVLPMILGCGVDSVLVMLAARDRGHHTWAVRSCPSIVASQVSTMCSLLVGLTFQIAHFFNFFVFAASALLVGCGMQITLFPALIVAFTNKAEDGVRTLSPRNWRRLGVVLMCIASALVCGVGIGGGMRGVNLTFDLLDNLHSSTTTHAFLKEVIGGWETPTAPVLALLRGGARGPLDGVDRNAVDALKNRTAHIFGDPVTVLSDWHDTFFSMSAGTTDPGGATAVRAWLNDPTNRVLYGTSFADPALLRDNRSVVTVLAPFAFRAPAREHHEQLRAIRAQVDAPGVCATSIERLGGYTIVETYGRLWVLVAASVTLSTIAAVALSGYLGVVAIIAVLGAYSATLGLVATLGIPIHIMVISALVVLPGIVIDYVLHLTFSVDTLVAVIFSYLTSSASFVPYLFSHTPGVRHFAEVYLIGLACGIGFALLAVSLKSTRAYGMVLLQDEKNDNNKSGSDTTREIPPQP